VSRCQAQRQLEVPQAPDCQVITAPEWDFATVLLHTYYDDDDSSSAAGYQPQPLACTHVSTSLITSLLPLKHAGFTYKHYFSHHPGPLLLHKNKKSPKLINNQRFESPLTLRTRTNTKTRKTLPTISCGQTSPTRTPAHPSTSRPSGRARSLDTASTITSSHPHADATTRTSPLPTPLVPSHRYYRAP
jgi:hypothetical protein